MSLNLLKYGQYNRTLYSLNINNFAAILRVNFRPIIKAIHRHNPIKRNCPFNDATESSINIRALVPPLYLPKQLFSPNCRLKISSHISTLMNTNVTDIFIML